MKVALEHTPVLDPDDPVGIGRDLRVVGHHHDREARLVSHLEQVEDLLARRRIEIPRRFIGEQDVRFVPEGPAIAVRCRSPPESWLGRWAIR